MKLWLVQRPDKEVDWDETAAIVVRAESERAALDAFSSHVRRERPAQERGYNPSVREITPDGPAEVILVDFNAG